MALRVGKRCRVGQLGTELLQRRVLWGLVQVGAELPDGEGGALFGGFGQQFAQLRVRQYQRLQGFHESSFH